MTFSDTFVTKSIQKFWGRKNSLAAPSDLLFSSLSDSFLPQTPTEVHFYSAFFVLYGIYHAK